MMVKHVIGNIADFKLGMMKDVAVDGKSYLLVNLEGSLFCLDAFCTHARGHLLEGKLEGNVLTCPKHKAQFDVRTGKNLKKPSLPLAKAADLKSYPVRKEGDSVILDIA